MQKYSKSFEVKFFFQLTAALIDAPFVEKITA